MASSKLASLADVLQVSVSEKSIVVLQTVNGIGIHTHTALRRRTTTTTKRHKPPTDHSLGHVEYTR